VHLANLVHNTGIEQDAFRGRGLASVDMSGNADIPDAIEGKVASHVMLLRGNVAKKRAQLYRLTSGSR
jgi:hypothetical protein